MRADTDVLILAGEGPPDARNIRLPRCLTEIRPGVTLLEHQILALQFYGVAFSNIAVLIDGGRGWSTAAIETVRSLAGTTIVEPTAAGHRSGRALQRALSRLNMEQDLVVVNGDLIFGPGMVDVLAGTEASATILTRPANSLGDYGVPMTVNRGGRVLCGPEVNRFEYPWRLFAGLMSFTEDVRNKILSQDASSEATAVELVVSAADRQEICLVSLESYASSQPIDLQGGSDAWLERRNVVRKSASGDAASKLQNEATWLSEVPGHVRNHFPRVLASGVSGRTSWYEMDWFPQTSLRRALMTGLLGRERARDVVTASVNFFNEHFYSSITRETPTNWMDEAHFKRFWRRLPELSRRSPILRDIIQLESLVINGRSYRNLPQVVEDISSRPGFVDEVTPSVLSKIHGDLHFQNILLGGRLDFEDLVFVDPRGELEGACTFYDHGKLLHSVNGLYGFSHTDQFVLARDRRTSKGVVEFRLSFPDSRVVDCYHSLRSDVIELVGSLGSSTRVPNWEMALYFNEAMHFASVSLFHLSKDLSHRRSLALYLRAVELLNDFFEAFDVVSYPKSGPISDAPPRRSLTFGVSAGFSFLESDR